MEIYCDESGGPDRGVFLTSAVLIDATEATRLLKDFRRLHKLPREIKGTGLPDAARHDFFELLSRKEDVCTTVVACTRVTKLGGWALKELEANIIYENLIFESCRAIPYSGQPNITVRPDHGTYKKGIMKEIGSRLAVSISDHFGAETFVTFAESHLTPGVQIADVIANTVFRILKEGAALSDDPFCKTMHKAGKLKLLDIELGKIRPEWLTKAAE
ncbi:DUF3800 domain-containing protein [Phyllobacterium sp. TAF24]|uniref:DUF3800 domain-containing protein n=1 Tax=Phyllobacterium sp. TAF24 TaxID=3233068 RepID=UPI003F968CC5